MMSALSKSTRYSVHRMRSEEEYVDAYERMVREEIEADSVLMFLPGEGEDDGGGISDLKEEDEDTEEEVIEISDSEEDEDLGQANQSTVPKETSKEDNEKLIETAAETEAPDSNKVQLADDEDTRESMASTGTTESKDSEEIASSSSPENTNSEHSETEEEEGNDEDTDEDQEHQNSRPTRNNKRKQSEDPDYEYDPDFEPEDFEPKPKRKRRKTSSVRHLSRGKGDYTCPEPGCGKTFSWRQSFTAHKRFHKGQLTCNHCGKIFGLLGHLTAHLMRHSGEKHYQCGRCELQFVEKSDLKKHMRVHLNVNPKRSRPGSKPRLAKEGGGSRGSPAKRDKSRPQKLPETIVCPEPGCGKTFTWSQSYRAHTLKHRGTYRCDHCNKVFGLKGHLEAHVRRHEGVKQYQCPDCEQAFVENSELKKHQKTKHSGAEPVIEVVDCPVASSSSTLPLPEDQIKLSKRVGRPKEPAKSEIKCTQCGELFTNRNHLRKHRQLEHALDKPPFICGHCESAFSTKSILAKHIQSQHSG